MNELKIDYPCDLKLGLMYFFTIIFPSMQKKKICFKIRFARAGYCIPVPDFYLVLHGYMMPKMHY